jgi:hypothetical protein
MPSWEWLTIMKRVLKLTVIGFILLNVAIVGIGVAFKRMVRIEDDPLDDELSLAAVLGGVEFQSRATALSYARVVAYAGGAIVDLSEANIAPGGLNVEAITIMGGVDITVPRNCHVILEATTVMGGSEGPMLEDELPADAPEIRVRCTTIMGGLMVHYDEKGDEPAVIEEKPEPQPIASV